MANSPALDETLSAVGPASSSSTHAGGRLVSGVRLGHFRIERPLGAGGMGEVYLATDLALDRPVAIKVLPAGVASGTARDRLVREARAQARVQHPNVGHIYFIGEEEGRLYFAMEYVAGTTLAEKIAKAPLPVDEALRVIHGAALGLREAQRSGFLHRDVKPSNLMVDAHGVVKVLDFGLAAGAPEHALDGHVSVEQTTMAGTPLYMAPEQARGEKIDLRADIYALGATLFHLVSGRPPFHASTIDDLVTMHATAARPPVPRGANPRTQVTAVDRLIARMMAPKPDERFESYDELVRAVEIASTYYTRPGGFLVRGIASGLDLVFCVLVLSLLSMLPVIDELDINAAMFTVLAIVQTVGVARYGTTLGKALFELEVVSIDGSRPTLGQSLRRALGLCGFPIAASLLEWSFRYFELPGQEPTELLLVVGLVVLGGMLAWASLRTPGKRTAWDQLAGTIVRYRAQR